LKVAPVHAIVNNMKYAKTSSFKGERMKYTIRRMKEETGMSEQALIMRMLWFAYEHDDTLFGQFRERMSAEWSEHMI